MRDAPPRIDLPPEGNGRFGTLLDDAVTDFSAAAMRARAVDPVVTELVRLRCAQIHDCRRCGALRSLEAIDEGLDEDVIAKVAVHETSDLDPAAKAALRLADAMILHPAAAGPELRAELHEHFSDEQIAEICFDVVKWSQQKWQVALRIEAPAWEGLAGLAFDEGGRHRLAAPITQSGD